MNLCLTRPESKREKTPALEETSFLQRATKKTFIDEKAGGTAPMKGEYKGLSILREFEVQRRAPEQVGSLFEIIDDSRTNRKTRERRFLSKKYTPLISLAVCCLRFKQVLVFISNLCGLL